MSKAIESPVYSQNMKLVYELIKYSKDKIFNDLKLSWLFDLCLFFLMRDLLINDLFFLLRSLEDPEPDINKDTFKCIKWVKLPSFFSITHELNCNLVLMDRSPISQ